jgi:hypothetical protein
MPQGNDETSNVEKGRIHCDFVFIAHHQSSVISQPSKRALHLPSFAVTPKGTSILEGGTPPVATMRTNQFAAVPFQLPSSSVAVVSLVGDNPAQPTLGSSASGPRHPHRRQGAPQQFHLCRRGRFQELSQRNTLAVDHHHPLRALAPLGFADARAPFLAGAKLPSTKLSLQSSRPRASSSQRNWRHTANHTSCSSHNRKRRQQVLGLGYSGGRSRQRAPVLSTHRMPSNTRRFSVHRRPRPDHCGSKGSIFFHCSSDKNGFGIPRFSHIRSKGAREKYLHQFTL